MMFLGRLNRAKSCWASAHVSSTWPALRRVTVNQASFHTMEMKNTGKDKQ